MVYPPVLKFWTQKSLTLLSYGVFLVAKVVSPAQGELTCSTFKLSRVKGIDLMGTLYNIILIAEALKIPWKGGTTNCMTPNLS